MISSSDLSTSGTSLGLNKPKFLPSSSMAFSFADTGPSPKATASSSFRILSSRESACMRCLWAFSASSSTYPCSHLGVPPEPRGFLPDSLWRHIIRTVGRSVSLGLRKPIRHVLCKLILLRCDHTLNLVAVRIITHGIAEHAAI